MSARRSRRWAGALCVFLVLMATGGCGGEPSPAEAAPELATRLEKVDAAIGAGERLRARAAVEALVADTEQARDAGTITDEQAEDILQAADALLERLPAERGEEPAPTPTPTEEPAPTPTEEPAEEPVDPEEAEKEREEAEKKQEEAEKKREEARKEREEAQKEREKRGKDD